MGSPGWWLSLHQYMYLQKTYWQIALSAQDIQSPFKHEVMPSLRSGIKRIFEEKKTTTNRSTEKSWKSSLEQLQKADTLKRSDLLENTCKDKKKKKKKTRVPLVLIYSKHLSDIHKIVRRHMHVLCKSDWWLTCSRLHPLWHTDVARTCVTFSFIGKRTRLWKGVTTHVHAEYVKHCTETTCGALLMTRRSRRQAAVKGMFPMHSTVRDATGQYIWTRRRDHWSNGQQNIYGTCAKRLRSQ